MENYTSKIQTPYLRIDPRSCTACWRCINACPNQVIVKVGFLWHRHIILGNPDSCIGCMKCLKVCPHNVFTELENNINN